jgi:hypothetical protein
MKIPLRQTPLIFESSQMLVQKYDNELSEVEPQDFVYVLKDGCRIGVPLQFGWQYCTVFFQRSTGLRDRGRFGELSEAQRGLNPRASIYLTRI